MLQVPHYLKDDFHVFIIHPCQIDRDIAVDK